MLLLPADKARAEELKSTKKETEPFRFGFFFGETCPGMNTFHQAIRAYASASTAFQREAILASTAGRAEARSAPASP